MTRGSVSASTAFRFAAFVLLLTLAWGVFVEPRRLVVRHVELELPKWPKGVRPLRVALLSDLHVGSPHWGLERTRKLVDEVNAAKPELILLAGDYVIGGIPFGTPTDPEAIGAALRGLSAPLGVVAVLGNHDRQHDRARIRRAFEANGIVVLESEVHTFVRDGQAISIAGLANWGGKVFPSAKLAFDKAPPDATIIALVHEPDAVLKVGERPAITLAGHTHGGQVRFPLIGSPILPSDYGQRFAAGHIVDNGRQLFVTTGIGTSILPIRLGVPPEVVILTLR
jgi:predicted MPP superfamily phosphohydrolase